MWAHLGAFPSMHKLIPSTDLTTQLKDSYYSYAYFTSQVWINPFCFALRSCSCISTAGMSVPNHASSESVQLCEQTAQRQQNHLVQQNHLKAVGNTWCKRHGHCKLGLAPQMWLRHPGHKKQRCSWYPFLQPNLCFWQQVYTAPETLESVPSPPSLQTELSSHQQN